MQFINGMETMRHLKSYLEKVLGPAVSLREFPGARLRGLPAFLAGGYRFWEWQFLGQELVLAESDLPAREVSATELREHARQLVGHLGRPVVFVLAGVEPYQRNRLVQLGVAFIVPGLQLFIPPFAHLTEQFQQQVQADKLSAAAQATVLYRLLRHPNEGTLLNQWAAWLGYSAMTLSKVRNELVAAGLCEREPGAKVRGLRFVVAGRALWEKARPFLKTPVRRGGWARFDKRPDGFLPAGITALAKRTLLEGDARPTYACRDANWEQLLQAEKVRVAEHQDEAIARVELWRYDPGLLAKGGEVDPLSLHLSLADSADERVRLAAAELLEQVAW
jgi:DNA-binding MarR family transcriptional regulator